MVFALAVASNFLATLTFEINRGRVEEDQVNLAEQIPSLLEEFFLDLVLGAARRGQNPSARLVWQRLAQEGHGTIKMM